MATLWLHTASLLILLVMSCPGSQATATHYLCGAHLVDALYFICGERGFFYMPRSDNNPVQQSFPPKEGRAVSVGGENGVSQDHMEMMVKRSIVEQCCHRPCSIFELQNYCY
ncbi:insulin-like protein [Lates japonicus]|uniref:Insulin n=1 Tax=Lates japonicus TaxID=270547 RepID=A0AAD3QX06_LATJO|nr:insulin-like protein [Lates japonicus]